MGVIPAGKEAGTTIDRIVMIIFCGQAGRMAERGVVWDLRPVRFFSKAFRHQTAI
jgi:hypothetical protein